MCDAGFSPSSPILSREKSLFTKVLFPQGKPSGNTGTSSPADFPKLHLAGHAQAGVIDVDIFRNAINAKAHTHKPLLTIPVWNLIGRRCQVSGHGQTGPVTSLITDCVFGREGESGDSARNPVHAPRSDPSWNGDSPPYSFSCIQGYVSTVCSRCMRSIPLMTSTRGSITGCDP